VATLLVVAADPAGSADLTLSAPAAVTGGAAPGYVDDAVCATCHQDIARTYRDVAMARSFYRPSREGSIEDFGDGRSFFHAPSKRHYEMTWEGDRLLFRRWQEGDDGQPVHRIEQEVAWVLGSGNHSRTYLYRNPAGELYQLPVAWYTRTRTWGMAPGFDLPDHRGVLRVVSRECMSCHNAYPEVPAGSDVYSVPATFPERLPEGTGCQRCHGPGGEHVAQAAGGVGTRAAIRAAIVNPARLSPELRDDVCFQCHMQPSALSGVRRLGRGDYSFRPGQPLPESLLHFEVEEEVRSRGDRFEINHHPYRLRQSRCWQESGRRLSCLTCHDPHRKVAPAERAAHYRAACFSCHAEDACGLEHGTAAPASLAAVDRGDCVTCHMPERRTQDVIEVVMTDHKIRRGPPEPGLLEPLVDVDPVFEDAFPLEPERAPAGELGQLYRALAVVRLVGRGAPAAVVRLNTLVPTLAPGEPAAEADLARGLLQLGRLDDAAASVARWRRARPDDPRAIELEGMIAASRGRSEEALGLLQQATAGDGPRPEAVYNLGAILERLGRAEEAEAAFTRAVALRPTFAAAWHRLGLLRAGRGDLAEAVAAHRRALSIEPSLTRVYLDLAAAFRALAQDDEARRVLRLGVRYAADPQAVAAALDAGDPAPAPLRSE
jgi:Flp pilus assembly protein TadD